VSDTSGYPHEDGEGGVVPFYGEVGQPDTDRLPIIVVIRKSVDREAYLSSLPLRHMTIILIMIVQAAPVYIMAVLSKNRTFVTLTAILMLLLAIATGSPGLVLVDIFGIGVAYWLALGYLKESAAKMTNVPVNALAGNQEKGAPATNKQETQRPSETRDEKISICATELEQYIKHLSLFERHLLLLNATVFRIMTTGERDTIQFNMMLCRPGRHGADECYLLYGILEEIYDNLKQQVERGEQQLRSMGASADALSKRLEMDMNAIRVWMATLGCRVNPDTMTRAMAIWAMLHDGIENDYEALRNHPSKAPKDILEMAMSELILVPQLQQDQLDEMLARYTKGTKG
jgi:hypothetical protein